MMNSFSDRIKIMDNINKKRIQQLDQKGSDKFPDFSN